MQEVAIQSRKVLNGETDDRKDKKQKDVISDLVQSDLAKEELTLEHLTQDACSIIGAGLETTASALTLATYHIIRNPEIYHRLYEELVEAIPDLSAKPLTVPELENLSYLNAVVQECKSQFLYPGSSFTFLAYQKQPLFHCRSNLICPTSSPSLLRRLPTPPPYKPPHAHPLHHLHYTTRHSRRYDYVPPAPRSIHLPLPLDIQS